MNWYNHPGSISFILRRHLPRLTLCSLVWEIAQQPFYTLWTESTPAQIVYGVAHCTAGDAMIGTAALVLALILVRAGEPAEWPGMRINLLTILLALAYTVASEHINLARGNWAYSSWMPLLPWIGTGLVPLAQWIVVPFVAWRWANRAAIWI